MVIYSRNCKLVLLDSSSIISKRWKFSHSGSSLKVDSHENLNAFDYIHRNCYKICIKLAWNSPLNCLLPIATNELRRKHSVCSCRRYGIKNTLIEYCWSDSTKVIQVDLSINTFRVQNDAGNTPQLM